MEDPKTKRNKKSDKQQKTFEKNGGFSQKHVRMTEALMEKVHSKVQVKKA